MGGAQGVEQGDADAGGLCGVDGAAAEDAVGERAAVDQFHDHVRAFVVLDHVVHDDDVRMPQLRDRAGLAQGAFAAPPGLGRGEGLVEGERLHGHFAGEQLVGGPPHDAHAAAAEPLVEPVTARDDTPARPLGHHASHHAPPDAPAPGRCHTGGRQPTGPGGAVTVTARFSRSSPASPEAPPRTVVA